MFWEEICAIKESLTLQDNLAPKMYLVYKIDLKTFKKCRFWIFICVFRSDGYKSPGSLYGVIVQENKRYRNWFEPIDSWKYPVFWEDGIFKQIFERQTKIENKKPN